MLEEYGLLRASICGVHRDADGKAYAWGDVSGTEMDPMLKLKARSEEMEQFRKHEVYEKVKEEVCWAVTGKVPIGTWWIDISNGDVIFCTVSIFAFVLIILRSSTGFILQVLVYPFARNRSIVVSSLYVSPPITDSVFSSPKSSIF